MALAVPACGGPHDTRSPPRGRPGNGFSWQRARRETSEMRGRAPTSGPGGWLTIPSRWPGKTEGHMLIQTSISVHGCERMRAEACRLNGGAWLNIRFGKSQAEVIQIYMDYDRADVLAEAINSGEKAWLAALEDEAEYLASRKANHVQQQWRGAAE